MEIQALGPTAIVGCAAIGQPKMRALLACLPPRSAGPSQLTNSSIAYGATLTAAMTLQTYVLRLRALLPAGSVIAAGLYAREAGRAASALRLASGP